MPTPRHWSIVLLPEYTKFFRKETHLSRNMFLRIPIGNYIRHYSGCRRHGSYPCYKIATPPNRMDIVHRIAWKKFFCRLRFCVPLVPQWWEQELQTLQLPTWHFTRLHGGGLCLRLRLHEKIGLISMHKSRKQIVKMLIFISHFCQLFA